MYLNFINFKNINEKKSVTLKKDEMDIKLA